MSRSALDKCNIWYHKGCLSMGDKIFDCYIQNENLEWTCTKCALNDISTSLFNTSISSVESDIQDDKPKKNPNNCESQFVTCKASGTNMHS